MSDELREAIEEVLSRGHTAAYDLRNDIHAVLGASLDDRVKKLEWTEPIALTGIITTAGPWEVYRRQDGECLLLIRFSLLEEGLTVDAAKALAERLQAVLSSPTSVGGAE